jgi:hypothetical protein
MVCFRISTPFVTVILQFFFSPFEYFFLYFYKTLFLLIIFSIFWFIYTPFGSSFGCFEAVLRLYGGWFKSGGGGFLGFIKEIPGFSGPGWPIF